MMDGKPRTFVVQVREYCAYDVVILANSVSEALEKAQAFYAQHRKPANRYEENGLRAELTATTVRCGQKAASQSWAKARAARDRDRDAAKAA
jgi:hypothetical protein